MNTSWSRLDQKLIEHARLRAVHLIATEGPIAHNAVLQHLNEENADFSREITNPDNGKTSTPAKMGLYYALISGQIRLKPRFFREAEYVFRRLSMRPLSKGLDIPDHVPDDLL